MLPEEVRHLRGLMTQEAFGKLLGVTRQAVQRWELPLDHSDARRPRGGNLKKLLDYKRNLSIGNALPSGPPAGEPKASYRPALLSDWLSVLAWMLPPEEPELLAPVWEDLENGGWRIPVETIAKYAKGNARLSNTGKVLARSALLYRLLFEAGDAETLDSVVQKIALALQVDPLPPLAARLAHQALALYYAWPAGRIFHRGKAFYHAAKALALCSEDTAPLACHGHVARLQAALHLGELGLFEFFYDQAESCLNQAATPFSRALALEMLAAQMDLVWTNKDPLALYEELIHLGELPGLAFAGWRGIAAKATHFFMGGGSMDAAAGLTGGILEKAPSPESRSDPVWVSLHSLRGRIAIVQADWQVYEKSMAYCLAYEQANAWVFPQPELTRMVYGVIREDMVALRSLGQGTATPPLQNRELRALYFQRNAWIAMASAKILESGILMNKAREQVQFPGLWLPVLRNINFGILILNIAQGRLDAAREWWRYVAATDTWTNGLNFYFLWRLYWGLMLGLDSAFAQARVEITSARHHFETIGDTTLKLVGRRMQALLDWLEELPGAGAALESTAKAMETVGLNPRGLYTKEHVRTLYSLRRTGRPSLQPGQLEDGSLAWMLTHLLAPPHTPRTLKQALLSLASVIAPHAEVSLVKIDPYSELPAGHSPPANEFEVALTSGERLVLRVQAPLDSRQAVTLHALSVAAGSRLNHQDKPMAALDLENQEKSALLLVGVSSAVNGVRRHLRHVAMCNSPVLLIGEKGTGRETVARALHHHAGRGKNPFQVFNQELFSKSRLKDTLFNPVDGLLKQAGGGVLFIREVTLLPLALQAQLADWLTSSATEDEDKPRPRIMAATSFHLEPLLRGGVFHEALFYHLQDIQFTLPPLRERPEDVPPLVRLFVQQAAPENEPPPVFSAGALESLKQQAWPDNAAGLKNLIHRLMQKRPLPPEIRREDLQQFLM